MEEKSYHSICRWTFNAGKGGFVPANARPEWTPDKLSTEKVVELIKQKIAPRLPENVELGLEVHYDFEVDEKNAEQVSAILKENKIYLAQVGPGSHAYFAYGGVSSLDRKERKAAEELVKKTVDILYGSLKEAWHPDENLAPTMVLWNGSFGYDLVTVGIREMYNNLKKSVASICDYEMKKGGKLFIAFEPKPNEGHPAMLVPTVASSILFWKKLAEEFGINLSKKGINKEFGHSEMIGLDHVYDTVEELDNNMVVHMHLNSQGYNDGIVLGGPGKYDIDHGVRINGMNIAIAGLIREAGYDRWKGHDLQPRAYDNVDQAIERIIRSILSWEACEKAAQEIDYDELMTYLENRETAKAEDVMRNAVVEAQLAFNDMYK